jgi:HEAT repeat protein
VLPVTLLLAGPLSAQDKAGSSATAEKATRDALARFAGQSGDWQVRMKALVSLARIGPAAAPVLVEALRQGRPATRELAAQALVLVGDPATRPALEQALADPGPATRTYAILALSMLGPLPPDGRHNHILTKDPSFWGVQPAMAAALARGDRPKPAELRNTLADYDLRRLDSARVGEMAPDFTLMDFTGKPYRLSQFRGRKTVVLRFILFDF